MCWEGAVGREAAVVAVDNPGVRWVVVVSGGEGVVAVVPKGYVRGVGQLAVGGVRDVGVDVVPEIVQGGHTVDPRPPFPCHGRSWGDVGWGLGHVRVVVAGAALGSYLLLWGVPNKLLPPVDGQHPDAVSFCSGGGIHVGQH